MERWRVSLHAVLLAGGTCVEHLVVAPEECHAGGIHRRSPTQTRRGGSAAGHRDDSGAVGQRGRSPNERTPAWGPACSRASWGQMWLERLSV